jgi:hypothetical protein
VAPASRHRGWSEQPHRLRGSASRRAMRRRRRRRSRANLIWHQHILGYGGFPENKNEQGVLYKITMVQAGGFLQNAWYRKETDLDHSFLIQQHMYEFSGLHCILVFTGYFLGRLGMGSAGSRSKQVNPWFLNRFAKTTHNGKYHRLVSCI